VSLFTFHECLRGFEQHKHLPQDAPNEWYLSAADSMLYWKPPDKQPVDAAAGPTTTTNSTPWTPAELNQLTIVVPLLETLVLVNGTLASPVRNVTISGITFRDTTPTFMKRYTGAGPGDW
jgi:hypothetical protein